MTQTLFIWGFLPKKTMFQSLVPSYWMPLAHRQWLQSHPCFLIPRFVHQLWCCWDIVLAKYLNICLYFKSEVNNFPISPPVGPSGLHCGMKLCWHRMIYDMDGAEASYKLLPWLWVEKRPRFLLLVPLLNQWKSSHFTASQSCSAYLRRSLPCL